MTTIQCLTCHDTGEVRMAQASQVYDPRYGTILMDETYAPCPDCQSNKMNQDQYDNDQGD